MTRVFPVVLLEVARKADQAQYFLITDGFARINSDRQADSSSGRNSVDHMLTCVSFS